MEKEVLKELVEFAKSNGLMRVPLDIVVRMFKSSRGRAYTALPLFYVRKPPAVLTDDRGCVRSIQKPE